MIAPKYSRYYTYIQPVVKNRLVRSSTPYIFSLITIAVFTVFVLRPTIETILELQKKIELGKQTLNSLNTKAQNLETAKSSLEQMDPEVRLKIKNSVPEKPDVISLITSLQGSMKNQATISGLQIQPLVLIDTNAPKKINLELAEIDFSFNVQGSYAQLLTALNNLNKTSRLIKINSVLISKQPDYPAVLSITGKSYYLK